MNSDAFPAERPEHDHSDIDVRRVLLGALAIVAAVMAAVLLARALIALSGTQTPDQPAPPQTDAPAERTTFEREKLELLRSYGWVDEREDIARVPIDRAMQMLAAPSEDEH